MIKTMTNFGVILVTSIVLTSCGGNETGNNEKTKESQEIDKQQEIAKLEKLKLDSINQALGSIKIHIFNHEPLTYDSEGWCVMADESAKITEVKDFDKTKTYNCQKGNYIQKLTIEGVFNGINIQFLDNKDKLIKEFKNYNLMNTVSYSGINYQPVSQQEVQKKDEFYQDWFDKSSKIKLLIGDSVFYSANWKNNGWSVQ